MTVLNLPQINFNSNPGYSDWQFLHQIYSQEFFLRQGIGSSPGIVDTVADPTVGLTSSRPLYVANNAANPLTLDITSGYALTPNFQLIVVDSNLSGIPLPTVVVNTVYVVCVEYVLVPSTDQQVNRFGVLTEVRDERPSNTPFGDQVGVDSTLSQVVTIATLADFNNLSIFSQDRKNGLVVIAVATVQQDAVSGQLAVLLDLTRTQYSFNRPWFSYKDTAHRSFVGTGVVTTTNPHGLSIQDLSSSGFTLFQQFAPRGGVFAKDSTYYGYPGTFCTELISANRYETDDDGTVTADSALRLDPLTGRYFVTLTKVPVRMGSLYFTGMPWKPVPYFWKPGTRYLILGTLEQPMLYPSSLTVEYFSVSALMPPQESLAQGVQSFQTGDPTPGVEWIVTGGVTLDSLANDTINLSATLGPIKKAYNVVCNTDGTLVASPQNLVPVMKVTDLLANGTINVNQAPLGGAAVTWTIGLTGAPSAPPAQAISANLNLQVLVNGVDDSGNTVQETITFYASQWRDQDPTALAEEPLQFRRTANKYQLVNYVQILNTTANPDNSGSAAILSLWANILEARQNQELANVASFFWDGLGARNVVDQRVIGSTLQRSDQRDFAHPDLLAETSASFVQELFSVMFQPPLVDPSKVSTRLALEKDDDRSASETWDVFSDAPASGTISVVDFSLITPGMTLRIGDGTVLTFVATPPAPDPTSGEVGIPQSVLTGNVEILNNIIATVNNAAFDSTWVASLATTGKGVVLTRDQAYPEGFVACARQRMVFTGPFTTGSVAFAINGYPVGTPPLGVTSQPTHGASLDAIVAAVNRLSAKTGVSAVHVSDPTLDYVVFNGDVNGETFTVTTPTFTGALVNATVGAPPDAFTLTDPVNGTLPTPHLPQRFENAQRPWQYVSRALQWVNVGLQSTVSFSGNTTANVNDGDQLEIVPGKILFARRGNPSPSITRSLGQFLVTYTGNPSSDLPATLQSMADTINDPSFASGCSARVGRSLTPQSVTVTCVADASGSLRGTYFLLSSTTDDYYVWYQDGSAVDPALPGKVGIPVVYADGSTAIQIAQATQAAMSAYAGGAVFGVAPTVISSFTVVNVVSGQVANPPSAGTSGFSVNRASAGTDNADLLISVGGYAAADISLLFEAVTGTWVVQPYAPVGVGSAGSTGFLKSLYPLKSARWRYQLIEPASSVGTFTSANVDILVNNGTITIPNHGLFNGDSVYIRAVNGFPPTPLQQSQTYFVVNETTDTFQLALTPGATPITLVDSGSPSALSTLYVNQPFGPGQWSPYRDMDFISPTAFRFRGPSASSLYAIQVALVGETSQPNSFSLYQLTPETGATNTALDARLTALDGGVVNQNAEPVGEVAAARGAAATLNERLSVTINPDGSRVQDPELVAARSGAVSPAGNTLKDRLDVAEGVSYWVTGGADNYLLPTEMGNLGVPNGVLAGPVDGSGYNNASYFAIGATPNVLRVLGSPSSPLVVAVNGRHYRFAREIDVDFAGLVSGSYYVNAEVRSLSASFFPVAVSTTAYTVTLPIANLFQVGDRVQFASTGSLPAGLGDTATYFVRSATLQNTATPPAIVLTFSATRGGAPVALTSQGSGTHTVTLVDQGLGQTVFAGWTTSPISSGSGGLVSASSNFNASIGSPAYSMASFLSSGTPLVVWIPSITSVNGNSFFAPISAQNSATSFSIEGEFPAVPNGTYFEVRSPTECSLTLTPFVTANTVSGTDVAGTKTATRHPIGQAAYTSNSNALAASGTFNFRYRDRYVSPYQSVTASPNYTATFAHNLGRIPTSFKLYFSVSATGDAAPVLVENEAIFQATTSTITVINRYTQNVSVGLVATDITRTAQSAGYLQLVVS